MAASRVLNSNLVEDVHRLVISQTPQVQIEAVVSGITGLTLTGLIEYGCLRWMFRQLPNLPPNVMRGELGRAITEASGTAHRKAVEQGTSDEDYKPRECEFVMFQSETNLTSDRVQFFCLRFARSAQQAGFAKATSHCLQAGLNEMMDNAVRHSATTARIVAGYHVQRNFAEFVVADVGRGVLASLQRCPKYARVSTHSDAIRLAIHDGVTSDPTQVGGRGFNDIFKALTLQWGQLRFRSGEGCIAIDGRGANADAGTVSFPPSLPGFQVSVSCRAAEN